MPTWKGIIGRSFTPNTFSDYVTTISFPAWRPQFVVLHNTAMPKLADWHSLPGEVRMKNLENYYKNDQQWSAGPHLFVADDLIWVFTPLNVSGVHSPSWNAVAWGVEMVGDYSVETFESAIRENVLSALATLHGSLGLNPDTLRLHKEDPRTTHICPGQNILKADIIQGVHAKLSVGEHVPGGLNH
ncbi:MAG TPA: peptidoglycan recognition family protein [Terriglobales bacterium]|nr:peptidoglycan recognition family protein [Terriglobales bacterium]